MKEKHGNIWDSLKDEFVDAICVTTNGAVKKNGECVMGRGVALQATKRFPGIAKELGDFIEQNGNIVQSLGKWERKDGTFSPEIVAFPVKDHWRAKARLDLINTSVTQLIELADESEWDNVVLPRPGCGNGQLNWHEDARPFVNRLDDRFIIINNE